MVNDRLASSAFFMIGLYGLIFSIQLPMGKWREPGPGVFPLALSILLCFFGVLWFARGKGKRGEVSAYRIGAIGKLSTPLKIVGATTALVIAWDCLGYLLASSFYVFFLFFGVSRYKCVTAIGLAVAIGVGSWLFFHKLLAVQLPAGLLPF
jgi:uncharacterized membrane protein